MKPPVDAPGDLVAGRYRVLREAWDGVDAVDESTGDAVLIHPRKRGVYGNEFVAETEAETAARVVERLAHPCLARVRCAAPRVVIDAPPADDAPRPLATPDIAACALQLLDAVARLHAEGVADISCRPRDLRVMRDGDGWRVTLLHPPLPRAKFDWAFLLMPAGFVRYDPVLRDLAAAAAFTATLGTPHRPPKDWVAERLRAWPALADTALDATLRLFERRPDPPPPPPSAEDESTYETFPGKLPPPPAPESAPPDLPRTARDLAEALLPFAPPHPRWASLVAAMPRVARVKAVHDWDLLIARGEAARVEEPLRQARWLADFRASDPKYAGYEPIVETDRHLYIDLPLAAAYHGRACASLARGERDVAARDLDRAVALDPTTAHLATRGHLRALGGDLAGAREDHDRAVAAGPPLREDSSNEYPSVDAAPACRSSLALAMARALYGRARLRLDEADARGALDDLERAERYLADAAIWVELPPDDLPWAHAGPPPAWIARTREAATRRLRGA